MYFFFLVFVTPLPYFASNWLCLFQGVLFFSHTCLKAFTALAPGLCKSCCLEIVCSRRHFQLSSRGKEKQFYAWATVNPSLSVPLLDALKSHSSCTPNLPHPAALPSPLARRAVIRERKSIHLEGETRMRFTCCLTAPSSLVPFTLCSLALAISPAPPVSYSFTRD